MVDRTDVARAGAWVLVALGLALLGASFGVGIAALPVRANLDCGLTQFELCKAILNPVHIVALAALVGGAIALCCGGGALLALAEGGEEEVSGRP